MVPVNSGIQKENYIRLGGVPKQEPLNDMI
jgi:hypothetical protein